MAGMVYIIPQEKSTLVALKTPTVITKCTGYTYLQTHTCTQRSFSGIMVENVAHIGTTIITVVVVVVLVV